MKLVQQMDCFTAFNALPDECIDLAFLDPPYNTGNIKNKAAVYDRNKDFERKNWSSFYTEDGWDSIEQYYKWCLSWLKVAQSKLKPKGIIAICGSFHNIPDVALSLRKLDYYTIQWLQWCIPNAFPNLSMTKMINANQTIILARKSKDITHYYDKEAAKRYNDGKNLRDYWLINNDCKAGKLWKHPSKKPVDLVKRVIDISVPKADTSLIVDFFAGSGTTGVAVEEINTQYDLNMSYMLSDNKLEYVEMMKKRLRV